MVANLEIVHDGAKKSLFSQPIRQVNGLREPQMQLFLGPFGNLADDPAGSLAGTVMQ
jgi:hypothetical protein